MGAFIIFIATVLILSAIGLVVWWVANKVYISIRRSEEKFNIEKEGYEKAKEIIREDNSI